MSAAGASAAIRNSIAVSTAGNRSSSFSFGAIRPSPPSMAGKPALAPARFKNRLTIGQCPSSAPAWVCVPNPPVLPPSACPVYPLPPTPPSVPTRSDSGSDDGAMSPTQTQGPEVLSHDEIQARIGEEVMPALSMMRTNNGSNDELLFPPTAHLAEPEPEAPATQDAIPASTMSPDDMLRAQATHEYTLVRGMSISYPVPAASGGTGPGGRTVYAGATIPVQRVEEEDDNESAYMGTAA
ncbi:hypothetical protein BD779DRAFT_1676600 [Infundibulicybe gibba]|nr:hypothetical protein BD779DRAFT_1676600 [Infundibulicybe gibba]